MQYRAATSSGPGERTSLTDRFVASASAPARYRTEARIVAYLERNDGTVSDGTSELGLGEWLARMFEDAPSRDEAKRCADRIASDIRGRRVASVPHQREARDGAYWMGLAYSLAETVEERRKMVVDIIDAIIWTNERVPLSGRPDAGAREWLSLGSELCVDGPYRFNIIRSAVRYLSAARGTLPYHGEERDEAFWCSLAWEEASDRSQVCNATQAILTHFGSGDTAPVRDGDVMGDEAYWLGRTYDVSSPADPQRSRVINAILEYIRDTGRSVEHYGVPLDTRGWLAVAYADLKTRPCPEKIVTAIVAYLMACGGTVSDGVEELDVRGWLDLYADDVLPDPLPEEAGTLSALVTRYLSVAEDGEQSYRGHGARWWAEWAAIPRPYRSRLPY